MIFAIYFNFPETISCTNDSLSDINSKHDCILIQSKKTWSSDPVSYMLPKKVTRDPDFNVSKVDCIAGFFHGNEGKISAEVIPKFDNLSISNYYYTMFLGIRKVLNVSSKEFVAMHWRRGDQLKSRCSEQREHKRFPDKDLSINCQSVENFINETKLLLKNNNITDLSIIVATNEESDKVFYTIF